MNKASEDKINFRLAMVPPIDLPVPAQPVAAAATRPKSARRGLNPDKLMRQFCLISLVAMLSVGCYFTISHYFVESVEVVGKSMLPTLHESNHYLLNRWVLRSRGPQHREIVVLRDPGDHGFSVKRVIAVGGESVHFKDGKVFVNGRQLIEPYLADGTRTFTYKRAKEEIIMCGKDQYFVLGDNRTVSIDSRDYGPVPRQNILGLLMLK